MAPTIAAADVKTIILACEAGVGSSLMSVNALKKKLKAANVANVAVTHMPARAVPKDAQLVVVHKSLSKVVRGQCPNTVVVTFNHFINDPAFDALVQAFVKKGVITSTIE